MSTLTILPIKRFDHAKQRLRDVLSAAAVQELVEAMLTDVLRALSAVKTIDQLLVITDDPAAAQLGSVHGATVLGDHERGHNAAAMIGIRHALETGADRVLLVPGDCPLLDPDEVGDLIARATRTGPEALIVPDRHGSGTNALLLTPPDALAPSFGPDSRRRHLTDARAAGIRAEVVEVPSLALDVDTPDDLAALEAARPRC